MFSTVKCAYVVMKLGHHSGARYKTLEEAKRYAEHEAKKCPYDTFEIFECRFNVQATVPVVYIGD